MWIFGTSDNPWDPYYHVSIPYHRDSILERGLEAREPLGNEPGVYAYPKYNVDTHAQGLDLWTIDPRHYEWNKDYNTEGAVFSPRPIDPAHLRLLHSGKIAGGFSQQDLFTCSNCGGHQMTEPKRLGGGWSQTCTICGRSRMVDPTHPFIQSIMNMQPEYPAELQELNTMRPMNVFGGRWRLVGDDGREDDDPETHAHDQPVKPDIITWRIINAADIEKTPDETRNEQHAPEGRKNDMNNHDDSIAHWVPPVLFHWTEARMAPYINDEGFPRHGVYLTKDDDVDKLNGDVPQMLKPLRVAIDTAHLDPHLFGQSDTEGYGGSPENALAAQGNIYYTGTIPKEAILGMDKVNAPGLWDTDAIVPESVGYEWGL